MNESAFLLLTIVIGVGLYIMVRLPSVLRNKKKQRTEVRKWEQQAISELQDVVRWQKEPNPPVDEEPLLELHKLCDRILAQEIKVEEISFIMSDLRIKLAGLAIADHFVCTKGTEGHRDVWNLYSQNASEYRMLYEKAKAGSFQEDK